jgi:hypothetical protein
VTRVIDFRSVWRTNRRDRDQRLQTGWLACLAVLAAALLGCVLPQAASAETFALSKVAEPSSGCGECMLIRVPSVPASSATASEALLEGTGEKGGLDPKDLREAYKVPETGGSSQTVAIVDAYNDPDAETDLEKYRKEYKVYFKGTETACTETNGCFKKIDVAGETEKEAKERSKAFPESNTGWSGEISLDVDMVSAACPECHILLVEANGEGITNFGPAEEEAAKWEIEEPATKTKRKATEISNSWGHVEYAEETSNDKYFDHPGIPIFASTGDQGYDSCDHDYGGGICYPAASPYVTAVGGTRLKKAPESSRKWTEEVWKETYEGSTSATGSGCSKYEPKPPGQKELSAKDSYCEHRLDNDVAADAARESAVSIYDTYDGGWENDGGTSAASPFIAGVDAHSTSAAQLLGANLFYKKPGMLFDITKGNNGTCTPPEDHEYFCTAEPGYDGPSGEGTPDDVFESVVPAGATGLATKVEAKGATLNGIANPNGATTKYYFEYGTTESYGTKTTEISVGSGTSDLEESKAITGLTAATKYDVRMVTTNANGTTDGLNQVFTTASKPFVETKAATGAGETEATLHGIVNPEGEETKYSFEYGETTSYGKTTPEASAGAGTSNVEVSKTITGLEAGKTYDFRIVATNGSGTSDGGNQTFATYLWTDEFPANPSSWNYLAGVSCTSASSCEGVGVQLASEKIETLAEVWNGSEWKAQTTPNRAENANNLDAVSCTSATACVAVGNTGSYETLAEVWNGSEWKIQSTQNVAGAEWTVFYGVSCTSATACTAVGAYRNSAGEDVTLAERWNGTEWTIETTPNQTEFAENYLESVSCASASECEAVGFSEKVGTKDTLAEHWNGTEWKLQSSPSPEGKSTLHSVSCSSSTACTAVGATGTSAALAERWNGSEWTTQILPNPAEGSEVELWGVSCATSTSCVAVGKFTGTKSGRVGLAEQWNGSVWALESTPNPEKATETLLWDVSCTAPMSCTAAGRYDLGTFKTLAEKLS